MSLSTIGIVFACFIVGAFLGVVLFVRGIAAAFSGCKFFR
ncbi:hypothetical protein fHeYen902_276 [Yersinia phage fHe-Yen9-02]|nr:hypothetical protein fHeYen902_276 [Yersinia phage fHe-Yen9-02]